MKGLNLSGEPWCSELGADPGVPPSRPYLEGVGAGDRVLHLLSQLRQVRGLKPCVWGLWGVGKMAVLRLRESWERESGATF